MLMLNAASAADLGAVLAALAVLAAPTVIALARDAQHPSLVILLTVLGVTLPLAFIAAFALPRRLPSARPRVPGYPPASFPGGWPGPIPGAAARPARPRR